LKNEVLLDLIQGVRLIQALNVQVINIYCITAEFLIFSLIVKTNLYKSNCVALVISWHTLLLLSLEVLSFMHFHCLQMSNFCHKELAIWTVCRFGCIWANSIQSYFPYSTVFSLSGEITA